MHGCCIRLLRTVGMGWKCIGDYRGYSLSGTSIPKRRNACLLGTYVSNEIKNRISFLYIHLSPGPSRDLAPSCAGIRSSRLTSRVFFNKLFRFYTKGCLDLCAIRTSKIIKSPQFVNKGKRRLTGFSLRPDQLPQGLNSGIGDPPIWLGGQ